MGMRKFKDGFEKVKKFDLFVWGAGGDYYYRACVDIL